MKVPEDLAQTDESVPALAKLAVGKAYSKAVESGRALTMAVNGALVELMPDGAVREIKQLEPASKGTPGRIYRLH